MFNYIVNYEYAGFQMLWEYHNIFDTITCVRRLRTQEAVTHIRIDVGVTSRPRFELILTDVLAKSAIHEEEK